MNPVTDPVLLEVIRYRLESIVEEMQWSLIRGSFSPVVKEALDASCSLFDADGTVIAQSRSNPSHLGSLVFSVRSILAQYPVAAMEDGDVYIIRWRTRSMSAASWPGRCPRMRPRSSMKACACRRCAWRIAA